jgi:Gnt-I system low-affinity gluconate transporter
MESVDFTLDYSILGAVGIGILILLLLILRLKLPAFLALLIASIAVGLMAGMSPDLLMKTVIDGMGSTLGFVATVVGLGALFGGILEISGGAQSVARGMMHRFGEDRAPIAMLLSGFLIAIPVFFDVAFIILIPVLYALQQKTGKSLLYFAIPLLAGLAITHSFIPPTPGPIAVADIIGVDLGWVMICGFVVGIPTAIIAGLLFGKKIGAKIFIEAPKDKDQSTIESIPSMNMILTIIGLPILLILLSTFNKSGLLATANEGFNQGIQFIGHPIVALIIANLVAWYSLGRFRGFSSEELLDMSSKSMKPAGIIILLTGAGGVFKQVLINTNAGSMLAQSLTDIGLPILGFAFLTASIIRLIQGSATVAMITAAGLVSPLISAGSLSDMQLAALVIAIASGASIFSHVNDSGFWLVKEYLGLTEKETFQSWTVMTTLLALVGFVGSGLIFLLFA